MKETKSWNEDVPYEVRMKHIIQSYRNDQEKWGKMEAYAKQLESEVIRLRNVLVVNGFEDTGNPEDAKPAKVIRELKAQLDEQMKTLARDLRDSEITRLKELIEKEYPRRMARTKWFQKVIRHQKGYIGELQNLLDMNDICYCPFIPFDELKVAAVENSVDEKAVRVQQNLEQYPRLRSVPNENDKNA